MVYRIKNTCGFEFCLQAFVQEFTEVLPFFQNTENTDKWKFSPDVTVVEEKALYLKCYLQLWSEIAVILSYKLPMQFKEIESTRSS